MSPLRRCLAGLLLMGTLASPAAATWSIIVADTRTGEVGIGSATCITNLNLKRAAGVIVVGRGAAQAQALVGGGPNRRIMWNHIRRLDDPENALRVIRARDGEFEQRQFGMVTMAGRTMSFTGSETLAWTGGQRGRFGTLYYAVQSNILTNGRVVGDAVAALRDTDGTLADKLMAAMQAARLEGGDSRCTPSGRSSYVGYMTIARMGDTDGVCDFTIGCANGDYYMDLNVVQGNANRRDVVARLQILYNQFRRAQRGHVDQQRSRAVIEPRNLLGDGSQDAELLMRLRDIDGTPLEVGGALVTVEHARFSARLATIGAVEDRGDGRYRVPLTGIVGAGRDVYRVFVDTGNGPVMMYPQPALEVAPTLSARQTPVLDARTAETVRQIDLQLDGGPGRAGHSYVVIGSTSGTAPGFRLGDLHVPLNLDPFTQTLLSWSGGPQIDGLLGRLDTEGKAQATLRLSQRARAPLAGAELSFAWVTLQPTDFASAPTTLTLD